VAFDIATLIEDISDEFKYYFPDAVKRRGERFNRESTQSVVITATSNGSSGYSAPHGRGGSASGPTAISSRGSNGSSRSLSSFGLAADTQIASSNVNAFANFISQFLK
jgi:hypothetical protein